MCMPKVPDMPARPADPPRQTDESVLKARDKERKRAALASGRQSTLLTGSRGLTTGPATTGKMLLGQ